MSENLSKRAERLRRAAGLSLDKAANRMGYSKSHLWEFEKGHAVNPTLNFVRAIAECYGLSLLEFLGEQPLRQMSQEELAVMIAMEQALKAAYERGVKTAMPPLCDECGQDYSDPPSKLCPGCEAYREHQR